MNDRELDRRAAHRLAVIRPRPGGDRQRKWLARRVFDGPLTGRVFFEEVIRENLDLGRPDEVGLIFNRPINRRTPGPFRTRVITDGVVPHLDVDYRSSRIKQYQ